MKQLFALVILISCYTTCFASEEVIKCTNNVLKQIYPNQNACVLQESIPCKLQDLPFVTYPIEISDYNTERFNFNKRFNVFPKAIIIPKSVSKLADVLSFLRKKHLNFSIRSEGIALSLVLSRMIMFLIFAILIQLKCARMKSMLVLVHA